ncbi:cytochrome P450 [Artemisia annua]|uniref:Cytochrome P450 n=1 Tax=Artemisia annua TaxID=35608 RepID=A0A2U1L2A2_ARTAN|nr:cytochrome P450 [Artemisia annua]
MTMHDSLTMMSDEEIIDTVIVVIFAGYYTSVLRTVLVRLMANNKSIYSSIAQEQEEIFKSKSAGEAFAWEDLTKMNRRSTHPRYLE